MRNAAPWIEETLSSIQQQSLTDWECIIVDDHSTDSSVSIVEHWNTIDLRIQLFSNSGKGIIDALRTAYQKSKGTYITRMDADDRMHPEKLLTLLATLRQKGQGWLTTAQVEYFKAEGQVANGFLRYAKWLNQLTTTQSHWQSLYTECVIPSPCWMIHRADLDRAGAFRTNRYPEDYDLCFRWYAAGIQVYGISTVLHYWRDHDTRASRTDAHYTDQSFLPLKMYYFESLHWNRAHPLILWGAGPKGKQLARLFIQANWPFSWVTSNARKIGHSIYGQIVLDIKHISRPEQALWITAISQRGVREGMTDYFKNLGLEEGDGYFHWF